MKITEEPLKIAQIRDDAYSRYLDRRNNDNLNVCRGACLLMALSGRTFPIIGQYRHAGFGDVVVIDVSESELYDGEDPLAELTLPADTVTVM